MEDLSSASTSVMNRELAGRIRDNQGIRARTADQAGVGTGKLFKFAGQRLRIDVFDGDHLRHELVTRIYLRGSVLVDAWD